MSTHKIFASNHTTIPHKSSHQKFNRYLTLSVGAGFVATGQSNAEVVTINISAAGKDISGVNAGVASGSSRTVNNWPLSPFTLRLFNNSPYYGAATTGLGGSYTGTSFLQFAVSSFAFAKIKNFSSLSSISSTSYFSDQLRQTAFKYASGIADPFTANNFVGFRFGTKTSMMDPGNWNYGWLETTWDGTDFRILSGAYENQVNTAILAGSFVSVPEPGTLTLGSLALLAGGGAAVRRYRKQRQTQSSATVDANEPVTPIA